jgi:hypothetical protein
MSRPRLQKEAGGVNGAGMVTRAPPALGNPRRLLRVLEAVAAGTRRSSQIAKLLDLELRVVRAYIAHAGWLGLLIVDPALQLTGTGLEYVYAGSRRAPWLAAAVRAHAVLGASPSLDVEGVAAALLDAGVSPSEGLARRDARAILRLVEPARKLRPRPPAAEQLPLGFGPPAGPRRPAFDPQVGDDSLDVYTFVLRALLEVGEMRLSALRGLLDEAGAAEAGLGAYVALALRRGDAERRGEALVVTPGALTRADLADSVVSVALSDPDFRAWLAAPDTTGPEGRRCARWGRRLFGEEPGAQAVPRLLFGRSLDSVPPAGAPGGSLPASKGAFLDQLGETGLALAFPASLARLAPGVSWVHQVWRALVQNPAGVRPPGPLDVPIAVHGGLLAPGEPPPRNIPDTLSLRLRAVRAVPAFALLVSAGLLHRRGRLRLRLHGDTLGVELPRRRTLAWSTVLHRVARARGWWLCPPSSQGAWRAHLETAAALGLVTRLAGALYTVDEAFACRLASDPEHHELHDRLQPLVDLLEAACEPE